MGILTKWNSGNSAPDDYWRTHKQVIEMQQRMQQRMQQDVQNLALMSDYRRFDSHSPQNLIGTCSSEYSKKISNKKLLLL